MHGLSEHPVLGVNKMTIRLGAAKSSPRFGWKKQANVVQEVGAKTAKTEKVVSEKKLRAPFRLRRIYLGRPSPGAMRRLG